MRRGNHKRPKHEHLSEAHLQRAADMFKAAGAPERLRLLECLRDGEACVTGLAEHLGEAVTTTSNRLQILAREGLVTRRREERHHYYRLADDHVFQLLELALRHAPPSRRFHTCFQNEEINNELRQARRPRPRTRGQLWPYCRQTWRSY